MDSLQSKEQVQAVFVSKSKKYQVPSAPILIPTNLKRFGLSEIINHLLENEKPIPFDFLINEILLKSTIAEFLQNFSLSIENILTIEFIESIKPPTQKETLPTDSWISSLLVASNDLFYVASYDSTIQIWNSEKECKAKLVGHTGPVKSITSLGNLDNLSDNTKSNQVNLLSAGLDQTIIGWKKSLSSSNDQNPDFDQAYISYGHFASVDDVTSTVDNSHFISASADSFLKIWSTEIPSEESQLEILDNGIEGLPSLNLILSQSNAKKAKKIKPSSSESKQPKKLFKTSKLTFRGHVGPVSSVCINPNQENQFFSGGADQSIRSWDILTGDCINTKVADTSVLDTQYSSLSGLIVSGHTDKTIRIWDPRVEDSSVVSTSLKGHSSWVKSLKWSSTNPFMLASASYDSSVKIWDIRSNSYIFSIKCVSSKNNGKKPKGQLVDKLLALDWKSNTIIAGGESGDLFINSF
ncbi:hypothetical protein BB561_001846 [Smittium simulii]|uniref:Ribosome biogenesis protein YTM1 n=1 Tax=Smittium simulii TaxID=133385 RepID=A0A2T9YSU2_9FUNG|nr:hypothetical protein BB561_001846 [Smittium simulii]